MTISAIAERAMTIDEFLSFLEERPNGERWTLDDGTPAMNAQPTRRHDWIQTNILMALRAYRQRHRPAWRPSGPSQVPVPGADRTVAPDVLVAPDGGRDDVSVTPDPIVVFEILSQSDTRSRQARKRADYEAVASIRHFVVVRQDRRAVSVYRREDDGRLVADDTDATSGAITLDAIGVALTLAEIYDDTPLAP